MADNIVTLHKKSSITEGLKNNVPPEYKVMLQDIQKTLPAMARDMGNFYKSHSQFMYTMLDVTQLTPIRSIKHSLAEINKTQGALEEVYIRLRKNKLDLKKKQNQLKNTEDLFEKELLEIEILETQLQIKNAEDSVKGAIRKYSYFTQQYKSLLASIGKTEEEGITEEEYEKEEEKYHIMTAMKQALTAARSRQGFIDEGNNIYLQDMGINGATAQAMIFQYLKKEKAIFDAGKEPSHELTMEFLESCYKKFKGCSLQYSKKRGFTLMDKKSLHIGET
jgi:hypothetical protein